MQKVTFADSKHKIGMYMYCFELDVDYSFLEYLVNVLNLVLKGSNSHWEATSVGLEMGGNGVGIWRTIPLEYRQMHPGEAILQLSFWQSSHMKISPPVARIF